MMQQNEAELLEYLLRYYGFELNGLTVEACVRQWRDRYPPHWLRSAIVEALYQGRYKVVSVVQILDMWQRREQSLCHYNGEFERMICSKFRTLAFSESTADASSLPLSVTDAPVITASTPLDSVEIAAAATQMTADDGDGEACESGETVASQLPPAEQVPDDNCSDGARPDGDGSASTSALNVQSGSSAANDAEHPLREPEVSLLEEEFLEIFAVEPNPFQDDDAASQAIPPFRPSADVPVAASRFRDDATEAMPDSLGSGTTDIYNKLKAALNRVVSASSDDR